MLDRTGGMLKFIVDAKTGLILEVNFLWAESQEII